MKLLKRRKIQRCIDRISENNFYDRVSTVYIIKIFVNECFTSLYLIESDLCPAISSSRFALAHANRL